MKTMIQVRNLSVHYGPIPALQDISLQVESGESVLITGPSGCGKSTLAKVICGLIPHAIQANLRGQVQVAGLNTLEHPIATLAQHVGVVFQQPSTQLFHLEVADEVAFGPRNLGLSKNEVSRRVDWALEVTGLTNLRDEKPSRLSGGQQQRVALAAVLAMQPHVIVLDEPTASLDVPGTRDVIHALKHLRKNYGTTILLIEHRLADAARLADRVILMSEGRICVEGDPDTVLNDWQTQRRFGLRRPTEEQLTPWGTLVSPNGSAAAGIPPLLKMQGVSAGYDRQRVIHNIDLALFPGEFAALVGDNGSGKSTLAQVIAGLRKPLKGQVQFRDRRRPRPGLDIALLFQNPVEQLFTRSVDEEVAFGPQNYRVFQSQIHEQTLTMTDLNSLRARNPFQLSVGQQQRTALAACLALRPTLLILDEPTLGQDWGHLQKLMDFLVSLNECGITILLITHDYKLVHRYAGRVILMEAGRITLDGNISSPGKELEMGHPDAQRWNARYNAERDTWLAKSARKLLMDHAHLLPESGFALDAASGVAVNGMFLAKRGMKVLALDISETALGLAKKQFSTKGLPFNGAVFDLASLWLPSEYFDVIVNFHFLERATFPVYRNALKSGGLLFFETYVKDSSTIENPHYYLSPNELRAAFHDFEVLHSMSSNLLNHHEESIKLNEQFVARKP